MFIVADMTNQDNISGRYDADDSEKGMLMLDDDTPIHLYDKNRKAF